jgi:hypothetical protein
MAQFVNTHEQKPDAVKQIALATRSRIVDPAKEKSTRFPKSLGDVRRTRTRSPQIEVAPNRKPKQKCRSITTSTERTVSFAVMIAKATKELSEILFWPQEYHVPKQRWSCLQEPENHCN